MQEYIWARAPSHESERGGCLWESYTEAARELRRVRQEREDLLGFISDLDYAPQRLLTAVRDEYAQLDEQFTEQLAETAHELRQLGYFVSATGQHARVAPGRG